MIRMVHNVEIVANHIRSFGGGARKFMTQLMLDAMNEDVMPRWTEHISLGYLSLAEREALDYPYSTKWPKDSGPAPDYDVHEFTGDLLASSTIDTADVAGEPAIRLVNISPHWEMLRYGTRFMRPRDPAGEAMGEALPAIQSRFSTELEGAKFELFAG